MSYNISTRITNGMYYCCLLCYSLIVLYLEEPAFIVIAHKLCRYVRSLVSAQLGGKNKAPSTLGTCAPQQYVNGIEGTTDPATGEPLVDGAAVDPCGLMPYSYFNDTYTLTQQEPGAAASAVTLDVSNIL